MSKELEDILDKFAHDLLALSPTNKTDAIESIQSLITQARREEMQYMITFGYTPEVRLKALEDGEGPTIELEPLKEEKTSED